MSSGSDGSASRTQAGTSVPALTAAHSARPASPAPTTTTSNSASNVLSCAVTAADRFLMNTGLADWLPEVFEPRASCAEADQALIGLPYSIWSAILAVILLVLGGLALRALWRSRVR